MENPAYYHRVPSNETHNNRLSTSPPRGSPRAYHQDRTLSPPRAFEQFDCSQEPLSPPTKHGARPSSRSISYYLTRPHARPHPHRTDDVLALSYKFRAKRQLAWIAAPVIGRFILNCILWALFIGIVLFTETRGALNRDEKHLFNTASVGVPLMLGLNYNSAFKGMAEVLRWKVLASAEWSVREADYILSLHSYLAVTRLCFLWLKKWMEKKTQWRYFMRAMAALAWVMLMLGSQVGAGLLGLTYDFNSENALIVGDGMVYVANLTMFAGIRLGDSVNNINEEQYHAHQYGDFADQLLNITVVESVPEKEKATYGNDLVVFQIFGTTNWVYQFQDWTPTPDYPTGIVSVSTNRAVTVSAECNSTRIVPNEKYPDSVPHFENPAVVNTTLWNLTAFQSVLLAADGITYVNPNVANDMDLACGQRCATIGVFAFNADKRSGNFSECTVTVSQMTNGAHHDAYNLTDSVARLAAGAIGLDGIHQNPDRSGELWFQFSRYSNGTTWGADMKNTRDITLRVGRFAIGAIALLDNYNVQGKDDVPGRKVTIGVNLMSKHGRLYLVAAILLGIHLLLIPVVLFFGNRVLVRDTSSLALAKLLRPLMDELGDAGCAASGKELGDALRLGSVTYGARLVGDTWSVELSGDVKRRGKFPEGIYDGGGARVDERRTRVD